MFRARRQAEGAARVLSRHDDAKAIAEILRPRARYTLGLRMHEPHGARRDKMQLDELDSERLTEQVYCWKRCRWRELS